MVEVLVVALRLLGINFSICPSGLVTPSRCPQNRISPMIMTRIWLATRRKSVIVTAMTRWVVLIVSRVTLTRTRMRMGAVTMVSGVFTITTGRRSRCTVRDNVVVVRVPVIEIIRWRAIMTRTRHVVSMRLSRFDLRSRRRLNRGSGFFAREIMKVVLGLGWNGREIDETTKHRWM
jgi:hypothetical protein